MRFAAVLLTAVVLAGCGGGSSTPASTTTGPKAAATKPKAKPASAKPAAVSVKDFEFSPATLTVRVGTKVTWTNEDATNHTVTFSGAGAPQSIDDLGEGKALSRTFTKPGTYAYVCTFHPNMKAKVVVSR